MAMATARVLAVSCMLVASTSAQSAQGDPRVCAIRRQTREQLLTICEKASIACAADADDETLRGLVYEKLQGEIPGNTVAKPWPGPGEPGECDAVDQASSAKTPPAKTPPAKGTPSMADMAGLIFQKLDAAPRDGKLSREEMQAMIDETNAAARAAGEAEHDLFASLDRDVDGFVSEEEAKEFFARAAAKAAGQPAPKAVPKTAPRGAAPKGAAPKGAAKEVPQTEEEMVQSVKAMFDALDSDKDGLLSKDEFKDVLAKNAADARARGEADGGDFWTSLDADSSGYIDRTEAEVFMRSMLAALAKGKDEL